IMSKKNKRGWSARRPEQGPRSWHCEVMLTSLPAINYIEDNIGIMGYKILALGTQVPGTSYVMSVVEQQDGQTTEKNE
ncbi:22232_t:CDS:2, partial [Rhizophagus irregularis]